MDNILHKGPTEELGGVSFTRTLRYRLRRALETEHLSLWGLCEGNLKGGLLLLGTVKDMYKKAVVKYVFLDRILNGEHEGVAPLPAL
jgi:hypothetical protein